jgi:gas vesicle protein
MGKFTSFLFGGAVGVVVGLLVAPRAGEETRALVADKVDEYWGKSQDFYATGVSRVQSGMANIQPTVAQKGDELRDKIESARNLIADQVAKNAATARDVINDKIPVAAEKINTAVDVARTQIDNAASALIGRATEFSEEGLVGADAAAEPAADGHDDEPAAPADAEPDAPAVAEPVPVEFVPTTDFVPQSASFEAPPEPAANGAEPAPAF